MCATETWGYFSTDPTGAVSKDGLYQPSEEDRALGAALRGSWLKLARTGTITSLGWAPVIPAADLCGSASEPPCPPLTTCFGRSGGGTQTDSKKSTCSVLESAGFSVLEWWINR